LKNKITKEDFLENQILTNLKITKERNIAVFLVNKANLKKNSYDSNLWLIASDGTILKKLNIPENVNGFSWKDDLLIYFMIEDNTSIFYSYDIDTDTSKMMFSIPMKVGEFLFTSNKMFFCSKISNIERDEKVQVGTELPFFAEGMGVSSNYRKSIYSYMLTNERITKITTDDIDVTSLVADEVGKRIAFISTSMNQYVKNESNLYLMDVESEKFEMIVSKDSLSISSVAFIEKDIVIFAGAELEAYGRNQNPELYTFDIIKKNQNKITENFDKSISGKEIATDSRFSPSKDFHVYENQLYYITLEGASAYLYKINKDGIIEKLSSETGTIDSFAVTKQGLLFAGLRGNSLHEIYKIKDKKESRLTDFNGWMDNNRIISNPEPQRYVNEDGIEIDGWVLRPIDYDENKKYPGILCIHGGPKMAYSNTYNHMMQLLANEGYFVFYCNPRGSDGKGNKFADIRGNFATYAYKDIMGYTDKVLESYGNLDANRLGVMGGSYGGYMTNYIIGQTSRFKAAVSERGISNLTSTFHTSDIGYLYIKNYMGGSTPWSDEKAYLKESPITYAEKVTTPTLFVHGKIDGRCNYTESLQMFSALKYFGVQTKICIFEDESHMLEVKGKPLSKIKRFHEILNWFKIHLNTEN
jgi:dipeptidyl aminopeptidase/acylaminoacyl peptidase